MTIGGGTWILAVVLLALTGGGWATTGVWLRRRLAPELEGSAACLVASIGAVFAAVVESEVLGLARGLYAPAVASVAVAVTTSLVLLSSGMPPARPRSRPRAGRLDLVGLAVGVVIAVAHAAGPLRETLRAGFQINDSLDYHLPVAVDFLQRHAIRGFRFGSPDGTDTYQPANDELLLTDLMQTVHRDVLVPLSNLLWAGLALLGGWVAGRASGRPGRAGLGAALVGGIVGLPFISFQYGEAMDDVVALALVVAAVAVLVQPRASSGSLLAGAAAGGLAIGVKASDIAVGGLLVVASAVLYARGPDRRRTGAVVPVLAAVLGGALWYVRDLVLTGDPIPPTRIPGLSRPDLGAIEAENHSIVHFLGSGGLLPHALLAPMPSLWGRLWWLVAVVAAGAIVAAAGLNRCPQARWLAALAVTGVAVYALTPSSAFGPANSSNLFAINVRYVLPALAVGMLALVVSGGDRRAADLIAVDLIAVGVVGVFAVDDLIPLHNGLARTESTTVTLSVAGVLAVLVLVAAVRIASARGRVVRLATAAGLAIAVLVSSVAYGARMARADERSFSNITGSGDNITAGVGALDALHPRTVVLAGLGLAYLVQGRSFDRRVDVLGTRTAHGGFRAVDSCAELHASLVADRADALYVFLGAASDGPQIAGWAAEDQHDVIARSPGFVLYRVDLTHSGCPA